jgi:halimadienyl-diphosphate synthase
MNIEKEVKETLQELGPGTKSITAYDTAWVARIGEIDWDLSSRALNWLCEHQLSDGSWGANNIYYYHDRVISTLAAMISLTCRGRRRQDTTQVEKGLHALEQIISGATQGLTADPNGATVGFEMIVPTLVTEAEKLGLITQQKDRLLGRLSVMRSQKLSVIQGKLINRHITLAYSAEMAGEDNISIFDIENLQEANGSIANSPSATAYFITHIDPSNQSALSYLQKTIDSSNGGASFTYPYDIYERAWVLWNIAVTPSLLENQEIRKFCQPHINYLNDAWQPGRGVGFSTSFSLCDGDDTSVTFDALSKFGNNLDNNTLLSYEMDDHFRCYPLEITSSIGANVHMLGAIKQAGFDKKHPAVRKILSFLRASQQTNGFWIDKWHISPYYVTSHAIIECKEFDREICQAAVDWILETQRDDGSWGSIQQATAEETAYCIQSLKLWQISGGKINSEKINKAALWLEKNQNMKHPALWISKSLNSPNLVVRSAILSALALAKGGL